MNKHKQEEDSTDGTAGPVESGDDKLMEQLRSALQALPDEKRATTMTHQHRETIGLALDSRGEVWGENDVLALCGQDGAPVGTVKMGDLPASIGRGSDADIPVTMDGVSRIHCRLERRKSLVSLVDAGSKNGTFLNGHAVAQEDLCAGDTVTIGAATLTVQRR